MLTATQVVGPEGLKLLHHYLPGLTLEVSGKAGMVMMVFHGLGFHGNETRLTQSVSYSGPLPVPLAIMQQLIATKLVPTTLKHIKRGDSPLQ